MQCRGTHLQQTCAAGLSLPGLCACRAYGRFNLSLWDDVMAEFQPLTEEDVIVVNFGACTPDTTCMSLGELASVDSDFLTLPLICMVVK